MAIPLLLAAAAAGIPAVKQLIDGGAKARKGQKIKDSTVAPVYKTPGAVNDALSLAEQGYYNSTLPGRSSIIDNIKASTANGLDMVKEAASSSGDIIDGITKLNFSEGQNLNKLAGQEAAYKQKQLENLNNQLTTAAEYADKEFAYNYDRPYQQNMADANALIAAGGMDKANGINSLANIATSSLLSGIGKETDTPAVPGSTDILPPTNRNVKLINPGLGSKLVWDPYNQKFIKQ